MKCKWRVYPQDPAAVAELVAEHGCHPAVAAVLINRGITRPEQAAHFLRPSFRHIRSPFTLTDMDKAVSRIVRALREEQRILVFGDYDADGITATALLFEFLSQAGGDVDFYIPDRLTEGYGLNSDAVSRRAADQGVGLIITVDCGVSSHDAVDTANGSGIDVIVTDHHEPAAHLPAAHAVLNPKRKDCRSRLRALAGVGVAFTLAMALRKQLREEGFWANGRREPNLKAACDLVALGTVADMVPLLRENRIYVRAGLEVMQTASRPGLQALIEVSGLSGRAIDTRDVAFRLAPRLNAAGRLSHASEACRLLITHDRDTARSIAETLDRTNTQRRQVEERILAEIVTRLGADGELPEGGLVLDSPEWHQGVIGIVASRLVNKYMRPVVLIAVQDGIGKGSARSPEGFNIFDAFTACRHHLERFGGHAAAAGLTVKAENIPSFRSAFQQVVSDTARAETFVPTLDIDAEIGTGDISPRLIDELDLLAPFGTGADEPLFALSDLTVQSAQTVGSGHTKLKLAPANGNGGEVMDAILFNRDIGQSAPSRFERVACNLRWNHWMNRKQIQLVIQDFEV